MIDSDIKCIELLKEKHYDTIKNTDDAISVLEELKFLIPTNNLEEFIKERLYVFSSKTKAYNWFM